MCDACARMFNRRALLRGAVIGGAAVTASSLWPSGTSSAGPGLEYAAMAEDAPSVAKVAAAIGASATVKSAASGGQGQSTQGGPAASFADAVRVVPVPNANALKPPPIVSREQWGADETIRFDQRVYAPVRKLLVHHSASANKPGNPAEVVRHVQKYHSATRGFNDTGYNFLIDHKGVIYEGRAARRYDSSEAITGEDAKGWGVVGAHAKRNNAGSCGICLIGDFDLGSPTDAAIASLVWLLAYKASRHRIDAAASEDYIDIYGTRRNYPNISGHSQVGSTACPGSRLVKLLPSIRDEVSRRTGHWDPLLVDNPRILRYEGGPLRKPDPSAVAAASTGATTSSGDPGTGAALIGIRVVSAPGRVYTAGKGRDHGNPAAGGATNVVALANATSGDGYWALGADGTVYPFGGVSSFGDAAGKGVAADLAVTTAGKGYWILMADGGIYPFGAAGYASSPKKGGMSGVSKRIVARPQADGYWVMVDNTVRAFGAAPKLGAPTGAGNLVDFWATPSGSGYWILTDTGTVVAFGDAPDKGDVKRAKVKWSKNPATHIVGTPSGGGYVVINAEGSMLAFGDAPLYASFGSSGMKATGAAPAFG